MYWLKMRGNVIDLAVGVVIGGAFGKITSSLVDNIIMPPLSLLFGKVDFSGLFISLNGQHYDTFKAAQDAHAPILAYGLFIIAKYSAGNGSHRQRLQFCRRGINAVLEPEPAEA